MDKKLFAQYCIKQFYSLTLLKIATVAKLRGSTDSFLLSVENSCFCKEENKNSRNSGINEESKNRM